ncbi:MAG: exopolysaccharide biosynthesis protein [Pseudomonadota bacterium]
MTPSDAPDRPAEIGEDLPKGAIALLDHILVDAERQAMPVSDVAAEQTTESLNAVPTLSLGDLFDRMEERSYGVLLLLLALPCCLPFVYLLPQIVALPMVLLAVQMAMGRPVPWLPSGVRARRFTVASLRGVVDRARRYLGIVERMSHPRLTPLTGHSGSRVVGALLAVPCLSILVPLPLTNTVPGLGVAVAAFGLIERDGLLVLLGLTIGLVWVALLAIGGQVAVSLLVDLVRGLVSG